MHYVARVKIAVARETREGETRVALVPELVGKLTGLGCEVLVEPGAGAEAELADERTPRPAPSSPPTRSSAPTWWWA